MQRMCAKAAGDKSGNDRTEAATSMTTALKLGNAMWGVKDETWAARKSTFVRSQVDTPTPAPPAADSPAKATRTSRKGKAKLHAYSEYSIAREKAWFEKLMDPTQTEEVPKQEQARFLRAVAARCRYEAGVCRQHAALRWHRKSRNL